MGQAVPDAGVAGHGLHQVRHAQGRAGHEQAFDAPVLVPQADFQVHDVFAVALEAEVPGFDDAGMDRAHGHFVDLLAAHPELFGHARSRAGGVRMDEGGREAHGLEPGMAFGPDLPLLEEFALEHVALRAFGCEARIDRERFGAPHGEAAVVVAAGEGDKAHTVVSGQAKEGHDAPAGGHAVEDALAEGGKGQRGNVGQGEALGMGKFHGVSLRWPRPRG
ncbi:hypothetical protein DSECCO2_643070 [anaerobic digester metagenome]